MLDLTERGGLLVMRALPEIWVHPVNLAALEKRARLVHKVTPVLPVHQGLAVFQEEEVSLAHLVPLVQRGTQVLLVNLELGVRKEVSEKPDHRAQPVLRVPLDQWVALVVKDLREMLV